MKNLILILFFPVVCFGQGITGQVTLDSIAPHQFNVTIAGQHFSNIFVPTKFSSKISRGQEIQFQIQISGNEMTECEISNEAAMGIFGGIVWFWIKIFFWLFILLFIISRLCGFGSWNGAYPPSDGFSSGWDGTHGIGGKM